MPLSNDCLEWSNNIKVWSCISSQAWVGSVGTWVQALQPLSSFGSWKGRSNTRNPPTNEVQYFLWSTQPARQPNSASYCSVHKPMNFSQNRYPPQLLVPHHPRFTFSRNAQRINGAMTNKCAEIVHTIDIHAIQASELFLCTTTIVSAGKTA